MNVPAVVERGEYEHPRVSPDGRLIAVDFGTAGNRQIWILDTERGIRTPLTTEGINFLTVMDAKVRTRPHRCPRKVASVPSGDLRVTPCSIETERNS